MMPECISSRDYLFWRIDPAIGIPIYHLLMWHAGALVCITYILLIIRERNNFKVLVRKVNIQEVWYIISFQHP